MPLVLTRWRCYNWHNLLYQDHELHGGDIFALGPSESGKTTFLDSVALVLTGDHDDLQWNAAANPAIAKTRLREDGRTLVDILLRKHEKVAKNERGLGYFVLEFLDTDTQRPVTVGCGGSVQNKQSEHVVKWWILAGGKRIDDIVFTHPETNDVLPKELFKQHNGAIVLETGKYRVEVTRLFFPSLKDRRDDEVRSVLASWVHYLNIAKTYGRLEKQDLSELVRAALPAPETSAFTEAKEGIQEMRRINADIQRANEHLIQLKKLQGHVEEARGHEIHLRANRFQLRRMQHDRTKARQESTLDELQGHETERVRAQQEVERLRTLVRSLEKQVRDIDDPKARELLDQARALEGEMRDLDADIRHKDHEIADVRSELEDVDRNLLEAQGKVEEARKRLYADLSRIAGSITEPKQVQEALAGLVQAVEDDDEDAVRERRVRVERERTEATESLLRAEETANTALRSIAEQAKVLEAEKVQRESEVDLPPVDGLAEVLEGLPGARAVYQGLEPLDADDPDAALLQEYLPRSVLAAIIPGPDQDTETVRQRVHRTHPEFLVVDMADLPEAPQLQGILACIDAAASDSVAVRYLAANYNDVRLLEEGESLEDGARAVWRSGEVLDGHAWHVAPGAPLRFLGHKARSTARKERLAAITHELAYLARQSASVEEERDTLARQRRLLHQSVGEALHALEDARIPSLKEAVERVRTQRQGVMALLEERQATLRGLTVKHSALQDSYKQVRSLIESSGAEDLARRQAELQARIQRHRDELDKENGHAIRADERAESTRRTLAGIRNDLGNASKELATARQDLMLLSGMSGEQIEEYIQKKDIKENERSLEGSTARVGGMKSDAMAEARHLCNQLVRHSHDLELVEDQYLVRETRTSKPLPDIIRELDTETSAKRQKAVERLEEIRKNQVLTPIGGQLKTELNALDQLMSDLNRQMKNTPFNGRHYRLQRATLEQNAALVKLIEEHSATNQEPLKDALLRIVGDDSRDAAELEAFFDYRQWFTFKLMRQPGTTTNGVEEYWDASSPKSSGGGQAAPHYVLAFAMLTMFYQTWNARLPVVLLDEAFRGVDSGNQLVLYKMAVDLHLNTLAANTDFTGHAAILKTADVLMFRKDEESQDTFIAPYSQEFGVRHAAR